MYDFQAECPRCGEVFSSGISFGPNVRNVVVEGNTASCPRCGSESPVNDGGIDSRGRVFLVRDVFRALTSPGVTRQDVERAAAVLRNAQAASPDGAALATNLVEASPSLVALAQLLRSKGGPALAYLIGVILSAIAAYAAWVSAVAAKSQAASADLQTQAAMIQAGAALAETMPAAARRELLDSLAAQYERMQRAARLPLVPVLRRQEPTRNTATPRRANPQRAAEPQAARKRAQGFSRARCRCGRGKPRSECCGAKRPRRK